MEGGSSRRGGKALTQCGWLHANSNQLWPANNIHLCVRGVVCVSAANMTRRNPPTVQEMI